MRVMRRWTLPAAAAVTVGALGLGASAAGGAACVLTPVLRDVSVNQGLSTYPTLARGKETLVRLYLSLPSCAVGGNADALTGATLTATLKDTAAATVATGSFQPVPLPAAPFPQIANLASSPALSELSPSDPVFVIPGSFLAPAAATGRLTLTLTATVNFTPVAPAGNAASVSFTTLPGTRTAITKTIERRSNALRILVVPMGNLLDASSNANVQSALSTVSRLLPVPDGTPTGARLGTLDGVDGGIRFGINAAPLDLAALGLTLPFCGTSSSFNAIKAQLAQIRTSWNSLNTGQADKVLGAVNEANSTSALSSASCAEGMASVSSPEAWIRASPFGGGIAGMELVHTFGVVPPVRSDGAFHSRYIQADNATGDLNRGMNVTGRQFLSDDRTVMYFSPPGWGNANVLLEPADYSNLLCRLGGQTTTECTTTGTTGTAAGVAAGPPPETFSLTAVTDGSAAGTQVLESFVAHTTKTPPGDTTSPYALQQLDAGGAVLRTEPITGSSSETAHDGGGNGAVVTTTLLSASVVTAPGLDKVRLLNGTTLLYEADSSGKPVVLTPSVAPGTGTAVAPGGGFATSHTLTAPLIAAPVPAKPDYYFLADSTGSMGGAIADVKANATNLLANLAGADRRFGAGDYKDFPADPYAFRNGAALDAAAGAAAAAIEAWSASGGGDTPEAGLFGLHQIATASGESPAAVHFRDGSQRTVLMFGDAPSHDPICPGISGLAAGVTEATATAELKAAGIKVIAIDVGNLDGDPASGSYGYGADCPNAGSAGQASRIATATNGLYVKVPSDQVASTILNAINYVPDTIVPAASCPAGISVAFAPTTTTVVGGTAVTFNETVSVGATAGVGNHTCTVSFAVNGTAFPSLSQTVSINVTKLSGPHDVVDWSGAAGLKYDVALVCGSTRNIVAVALTSTILESQAQCPGGGGVYEIVATNGFERSDPTPAGTSGLAPPTAPSAVAQIQTPANGAVFGTNDSIPLEGSAVSGGAPVATGDLHWSLDGTALAGTGATVDLERLPAGAHAIRLDGPNGSSATVSITVSDDQDGDGLIAPYEAQLDACAPAGSPPGDTDAVNGARDYDGDGILNRDEQHTPNGPCVAETSYQAVGIFLPSTFSVGSTAPTISVGGLFLPQRDLTQVDPGSVRIVSVNGIAVPGGIQASLWAALGQFGGAVFPRAPLASFLTANNLVGHTVAIRIEGSAPGWSFFVLVSTNVTP